MDELIIYGVTPGANNMYTIKSGSDTYLLHIPRLIARTDHMIRDQNGHYIKTCCEQ